MALLDTFSPTLFEKIVEKAEECGAVLPSCRYISHCPPPLDCCDVMAFYPESVEDFTIGEAGCVQDPKVSFSVELWYCISVPQVGQNGFAIPDPSLTTLEALQMQEAAYIVYNSILSSVASCGCGGVESIRMECQEPQGGCAGWKITATTTLQEIC